MLLGATGVKAARKYVDEIDPRSTWFSGTRMDLENHFSGKNKLNKD